MSKLLLQFVWHFGAQPALHMRRAHVLRSLVETKHDGREVGRTLLPSTYMKVGTVPASDSDLTNGHRLVPPSGVSRYVRLSSSECLDLMTKEHLVTRQLDVVIW